MYAKYAFIAGAIGAYADAGPVSGNVPPMTIVLLVMPVSLAPPSAPGTVSTSAASPATAAMMSLRTNSSFCTPSDSCL